MTRKKFNPNTYSGKQGYGGYGEKGGLASGSPLRGTSRTGTPKGGIGFTMADEAFNTGRSPWAPGKLRDRPVTFVKGGVLEPSIELDGEDNAQNVATPPACEQADKNVAKDISASVPAAPEANDSMPVRDRDVLEMMSRKETGSVTVESATPPKLAVQSDAGPVKPQPAPVAATISPQTSPAEDSDSGESEVILFKGRAHLAREKAAKEAAKKAAKQKAKQMTEQIATETVQETVGGTATEITKETAKPAAITLDEINVEIKVVEKSISLEQKAEKNQPPHASAQPGRELPDLDHLCTTRSEDEDAMIADYIANMEEDSDTDEPTHQRFNNRDIGGDDHAFGKEASQDHQSDDNDEDDEEEVESPNDNADAVDDETLARLLSKQEELGMGSTELILTDAWVADQTATSASSSRRAGKSTKSPRGPRDRIPSASAVADAFDDLDLMDWDRPSLQNLGKGKGKRGKPVTFGVVDPDMEAAMQAAFANDREKKKQRREEREALRAQGLLGKHANPEDLRVKYREGMSLEDIKLEITAFLLGGEQTLQLPPMEKSSRVIIHDIANKMGMKSSSTGSGDQRRPVLSRTKRTVPYNERVFEMLIARISRKYFPRLDAKGGAPRRSGGGRGGSSAVTYRDGDVVGASMPELGEDNKGRAMLQKMGWSSGMALGSVDNQGILQPVAQVVKRTKAGLGQG